MKILKLVKSHSVILDSGRADISSISLSPENSMIEYALVVDENVHSATYNHNVIQSYIDKNILTVLEAADPIAWGNFAVAFNVASGSAFIFNGGGVASWPITGATGSFTFTQGAYIGGFTDNFTVTQTGPTIVNGVLPLNVLPLSSTNGTADYACTVVVNGVTLNATLTVEFTSLGS